MGSTGYVPEGSLPYEQRFIPQRDVNIAVMPDSHPSESVAGPFSLGYMSNITYEYPAQPQGQYPEGPRTHTSLPTRKVRRNSTSSEQIRNGHSDATVLPLSEQPPPTTHPMDPPASPTIKNIQPKVKKGKGRGRGRGTMEEESPLAPKPGKGRAATQGVVIPIANAAREEALAEQALKRKRLDGDEPMDDIDEQILLNNLTKDTVETGLSTSKKKKEAKAKREHYACDRCFRNKTKVTSRALEYSNFSAIARWMVNNQGNIFPAITVLQSTESVPPP